MGDGGRRRATRHRAGGAEHRGGSAASRMPTQGVERRSTGAVAWHLVAGALGRRRSSERGRCRRAARRAPGQTVPPSAVPSGAIIAGGGAEGSIRRKQTDAAGPGGDRASSPEVGPATGRDHADRGAKAIRACPDASGRGAATSRTVRTHQADLCCTMRWWGRPDTVGRGGARSVGKGGFL